MLQDFSAFCVKIVGERYLLSVEFSAHANENVIRKASHIRFAYLVEHSAGQPVEWIERDKRECNVAVLRAIDRCMLVTDFVKYEIPESPKLVAKKRVAMIPDRIRYPFRCIPFQANNQALERLGRIAKGPVAKVPISREVASFSS